ncbi:MAG: TolC family protein [Pseudomonadota bacterium]|nr:TolC family protein [Pseudomonadota bacterium]
MKKLLFLMLGLLAAAGCSDSEYNAKKPDAAYYSDWDRAIRYDVDMQNMYANAPLKLEKPLDMYMSMALALKYNYTGRMIRYQESLVQAGKSTYAKLPEIASNAGYINTDSNGQTSPDLKVAWNILDISTLYYMDSDPEFKKNVAVEQSRKVIQNILQEARILYWKALTAQRLIPVIDDTIEHITLDVDEMNVQAKELARQGKNPSTEELVKKRKYMEAVKKLSALKRDMETAHEQLASLMGLHPATQFTLVGKEYGNFSLPEIKSNLSRLEWLALTNRPELKVHDLLINADDLEMIISDFRNDNGSGYKNNPNAYNQKWCNAAKEASMIVYEDTRRGVSPDMMTELRRQRMTSLILNQVYIAWARYISATEDYQIAYEIAGTSENIAEDVTSANGSHAEKSQLEAARAIADETKASLAYVDLQDALGTLYATIGLDAVPYYMLNESPSRIALALRDNLDKWRKGEFIPDNRPYLMDIPSRRPPVNLSSEKLLPDVTYETGEHINIVIPDSVFEKMGWKDVEFTTKAGLIDDSPLPKWLKYNPATRIFSGMAMPKDGGVYHIKIYALDKNNNIAYLTFKLTIVEVYVPSIKVRGLNKSRKATVMKRCHGNQCTDETLDDVQVFAPVR